MVRSASRGITGLSVKDKVENQLYVSMKVFIGDNKWIDRFSD